MMALYFAMEHPLRGKSVLTRAKKFCRQTGIERIEMGASSCEVNGEFTEGS
jgi:hypothetical protein